MNNYLCARGHHFRSLHPTCIAGGCTAEVRQTSVNPAHGRAPAFESLRRLPGATTPAPTPAAQETPSETASAATEPGSGSVKHTIRWHAYVDGTRTLGLRAKESAAWDATCACGWDSATGGKPRGKVDKMVQAHKAGVL